MYLMKYMFLVFLWKNLTPIKPLEKEWLKKQNRFLKSQESEYLWSICYIPKTTLDHLTSWFCLKIHSIFWEIEIVLVSDEETAVHGACETLPKLTDAASVRTKIQTGLSRVLSWCNMAIFLRTPSRFGKSWSVFDWNSGPLQGLFPETLVLQYSCWTDGAWGSSLALNLITPLLATLLCPRHWHSIAFRPDWRLFIWATKEARPSYCKQGVKAP